MNKAYRFVEAGIAGLSWLFGIYVISKLGTVLSDELIFLTTAIVYAGALAGGN